ncbi:MAG TPA: hypothetical protein PKD86_06265, partial [Gemmatales bacterium]|nr:hypothetical protein [Gemmatales bacterium]
RLSRHCADAGDAVTVFTTDALGLEAFWSPAGATIPAGVEQANGIEIRRYPLLRMPGRRWLLKPLSLLPLRLRLTGPMECKRFSLYRRVPESGQISVTMALTGIGTAYFDDVRIEPLIPAAPTTAENEASQAPTARPAQVIID